MNRSSVSPLPAPFMRTPVGMASPPPARVHRLRRAGPLVAALVLAACAAAPAIQPAATSRSHFEGSLYGGDTTTFAAPTPGEDAYRAFQQANTAFVPLQSVRTGAEERAAAHCKAKNRAVRVLAETVARPPYIQDNFARAEIVFECIVR